VPPASACAETGPASSEVTRAICRVPSTPFSRAPWYTLPVHLCRFRVRSCCRSSFLERISRRDNPISPDNGPRSSLSAGRGMFTPFPSATAFALTLGAGSPCADWPCAGTLGLAASGVLTRFIATHVSILTSDTSSRAHTPPSQAYGTLRYHADQRSASAASVHGFSPVTSSAQDGLTRPVSCYAFFKGWLLLSQPPGCLGLPTSFPT
jgi:hypothetical protein